MPTFAVSGGRLVKAQEIRNGVLVNPELPKGFDGTSNSIRKREDLMTWWRQPYVIQTSNGFNVHCLDGGAWDRPTSYGRAASLDEAIELAWARMREHGSQVITQEDLWQFKVETAQVEPIEGEQEP